MTDSLLTNIQEYKKKYPQLKDINDHDLVDQYYSQYKNDIDKEHGDLNGYKKFLGLETASSQDEEFVNELVQDIELSNPKESVVQKEKVGFWDNTARTLGPAAANFSNSMIDLFIPNLDEDVYMDIVSATTTAPFLSKSQKDGTFIPKVALSKEKTIVFDDRQISDEEMLARLVVAEAEGEGKIGRALVASSVLNRLGIVQNDLFDEKGQNFNQKEDTFIGLLLGKDQYSPVTKDGRVFEEISEEQLQMGYDAIALAMNTGQLELTLRENGYDKESIKDLLAATSFRRYDAEEDISQLDNPRRVGDHVFNTAGNSNNRLMRDGPSTSSMDLYSEMVSSSDYEELSPYIREQISKGKKGVDDYLPKQIFSDMNIEMGKVLFGEENVETYMRDGIRSLRLKKPTYWGGEMISDVSSLAANIAGWYKALPDVGKKMIKSEKGKRAYKWMKGNVAALLGEQTGWDIYREDRLFNMIGAYADEEQKNDLMQYLAAQEDSPQLEARVGVLVEGSLLNLLGLGVYKTTIQPGWEKGLKPAKDAVMKRLRGFRESIKENPELLAEYNTHVSAKTVYGEKQLAKTPDEQKQMDLFGAEKEKGKPDPKKFVEDPEELRHGWQMAGLGKEDWGAWNNVMKRNAYQWVGGQIFRSRGNYTPKLFDLIQETNRVKRAWQSNAERHVVNLEKSIDSLVARMKGDDAPWIGTPYLDVIEPDFISRDLAKRKELRKEELITQLNYYLDPDFAPYKVELKDLPKSLQKDALAIRNQQDELSKLYMQSEYVPDEVKEVIGSNLGKYLRRSWLKYSTGYKPPLEHILEAQTYFEKEIRKNISVDKDLNKRFLTLDGQKFEITKYQGKNVIELDGVRTPVDEAISKNAKATVEGIVGDKEAAENVFQYVEKIHGRLTGSMKARKDFPKEVQQLLGRTDDVRGNVFTSLTKLSDAIETDRFMTNAWELGKGIYFHSTRQPGMKQITDPKMGALTGKWTTKGVHRIFREQPRWKSNMMKAYGYYLQGKGYAQASKTVFNHITHLRNTMGGAMFMLANGMNPFSEENVDAFKFLVKENDAEKIARYERYHSLGIVNTSAKVGDYRALINDAEQFGIEGVTSRLTDSKLSKIPQQVQKLYIAEDDLFKIAAFEKEIKTLRSAYGPNYSQAAIDAEAAFKVRMTIPNYDLVPPGIKWLRKLPLGNFFSFPAEMVRTSYHALHIGAKEIMSDNPVIRRRGYQRMAGMTVSAGLGSEMLGGATQMMSGTDDNTDDAIRHLLEADYAKYTKRLYYRDSEGVLYVNNFSYVDPYDTIKEPIRVAAMELADGNKTEKEMQEIIGNAAYEGISRFLEPFASEALLTEAITDVRKAMAGSTEHGDKIDGWDSSEGGDLAEKSINNSQMAIYHVMKSFVPGAAPQLDKLFKSFSDDPVLASGQELDPTAELIANFTGLRWKKVTPQYVENSLVSKLSRYTSNNKEFKRQIGKNINKDTTELKFLEAYLKAEKNNYFNYQTLSLAHQGAINLYRDEFKSGMPIGKVNDILEMYMEDTGRITEEERASLNSNMYVPLGISDKMKERIVQELKFEHTTPQQFLRILVAYEDQFRKLPVIDDGRAPSLNMEKAMRAIRGKASDRLKKFEGGKISDTFPVSNVKIEPSEMINKYTGMPYEQEMERLGFAGAGVVVNPILKNLLKRQKETDFLDTADMDEIHGGTLSDLETKRILSEKRKGFIEDDRVKHIEGLTMKAATTLEGAPENLKGQALIDYVYSPKRKQAVSKTEKEWIDNIFYNKETDVSNMDKYEMLDLIKENQPQLKMTSLKETKAFEEPVFADVEGFDPSQRPTRPQIVDPIDGTDYSIIDSEDIIDTVINLRERVERSGVKKGIQGEVAENFNLSLDSKNFLIDLFYVKNKKGILEYIQEINLPKEFNSEQYIDEIGTKAATIDRLIADSQENLKLLNRGTAQSGDHQEAMMQLGGQQEMLNESMEGISEIFNLLQGSPGGKGAGFKIDDIPIEFYEKVYKDYMHDINDPYGELVIDNISRIRYAQNPNYRYNLQNTQDAMDAAHEESLIEAQKTLDNVYLFGNQERGFSLVDENKTGYSGPEEYAEFGSRNAVVEYIEDVNLQEAEVQLRQYVREWYPEEYGFQGSGGFEIIHKNEMTPGGSNYAETIVTIDNPQSLKGMIPPNHYTEILQEDSPYLYHILTNDRYLITGRQKGMEYEMAHAKFVDELQSDFWQKAETVGVLTQRDIRELDTVEKEVMEGIKEIMPIGGEVSEEWSSFSRAPWMHESDSGWSKWEKYIYLRYGLVYNERVKPGVNPTGPYITSDDETFAKRLMPEINQYHRLGFLLDAFNINDSMPLEKALKEIAAQEWNQLNRWTKPIKGEDLDGWFEAEQRGSGEIVDYDGDEIFEEWIKDETSSPMNAHKRASGRFDNIVENLTSLGIETVGGFKKKISSKTNKIVQKQLQYTDILEGDNSAGAKYAYLPFSNDEWIAKGIQTAIEMALNEGQQYVVFNRGSNIAARWGKDYFMTDEFIIRRTPPEAKKALVEQNYSAKDFTIMARDSVTGEAYVPNSLEKISTGQAFDYIEIVDALEAFKEQGNSSRYLTRKTAELFSQIQEDLGFKEMKDFLNHIKSLEPDVNHSMPLKEKRVYGDGKFQGLLYDVKIPRIARKIANRMGANVTRKHFDPEDELFNPEFYQPDEGYFTIEFTDTAVKNVEEKGTGTVFKWNQGGFVNILQQRRQKYLGGHTLRNKIQKRLTA